MLNNVHEDIVEACEQCDLINCIRQPVRWAGCEGRMFLNGEIGFSKWQRVVGVDVVILVQTFTQPTVDLNG